MIGDVNLFLHPPEEEGDLGDVECEVMIAGELRLCLLLSSFQKRAQLILFIYLSLQNSGIGSFRRRIASRSLPRSIAPCSLSLSFPYPPSQPQASSSASSFPPVRSFILSTPPPRSLLSQLDLLDSISTRPPNLPLPFFHSSRSPLLQPPIRNLLSLIPPSLPQPRRQDLHRQPSLSRPLPQTRFWNRQDQRGLEGVGGQVRSQGY